MEKWIKYTNNTTCHGVSNVFDHDRKVSRRVIWLLMILGTFLFMVFTISSGVSKLLHPEYVTQIFVKRQSSIPFPSVTICQNNMYRKRFVEANPDVLAYVMLTAGEEAKWITENTTLMEIARSMSLKDVDQAELTQKLISASHPMSSIVGIISGFNEQSPSNKLDWFTPQLTSMGMCYRFNKTEFVKYPGEVYGLRVMSVVKTTNYFYKRGSLGSVGLKLFPHSQDVFPEVQSRGIGVPPKIETFISFRKTITYRLPETGCVPEGSNTLDLYDTYSQSACINECFVKHKFNICGCKYYYDPGNYSLCLTREEFVCLHQLTKNDSFPEMSCDCPPKCVEETFDTKISGLPYPSPYVEDLTRRKEHWWLTQNWENTMAMTIYFETLDVTTIHEQRAYTTVDFFSDVGGLMGLWLGASVITWAELIEVLWDLCTNTKHDQKAKIIKVKPADMGGNISK